MCYDLNEILNVGKNFHEEHMKRKGMKSVLILFYHRFKNTTLLDHLYIPDLILKLYDFYKKIFELYPLQRQNGSHSMP